MSARYEYPDFNKLSDARPFNVSEGFVEMATALKQGAPAMLDWLSANTGKRLKCNEVLVPEGSSRVRLEFTHAMRQGDRQRPHYYLSAHHHPQLGNTIETGYKDGWGRVIEHTRLSEHDAIPTPEQAFGWAQVRQENFEDNDIATMADNALEESFSETFAAPGWGSDAPPALELNLQMARMMGLAPRDFFAPDYSNPSILDPGVLMEASSPVKDQLLRAKKLLRAKDTMKAIKVLRGIEGDTSKRSDDDRFGYVAYRVRRAAEFADNDPKRAMGFVDSAIKVMSESAPAAGWVKAAEALLAKSKGKTQDDLHYRAYLRSVQTGTALSKEWKDTKGAKRARQDLMDLYGTGKYESIDEEGCDNPDCDCEDCKGDTCDCANCEEASTCPRSTVKAVEEFAAIRQPEIRAVFTELFGRKKPALQQMPCPKGYTHGDGSRCTPITCPSGDELNRETGRCRRKQIDIGKTSGVSGAKVRGVTHQGKRTMQQRDRFESRDLSMKIREISELAGTSPPWYVAETKESATASVEGYLSRMRKGAEIDAWGLSRALDIQPMSASRALDALEAEGKVDRDGNWYSLTAKYARELKKKSVAEAKADDTYLGERQKSTPTLAYSDEEKPTRKGAFKVSSKLLRMWKSEVGKEGPSKLLFTQVQARIAGIPREDLPKIWGLDNMADAQDLISMKPKKAFQMWLRNVKRADPKMQDYIKRVADNVPLVYYGFMARVVGNDMADIIFKRHFETESGHVGELKRGGKQ